MSLLQRSLDPEKTLGLVDVLYTTVFDLNRWKERKSVGSFATLLLERSSTSVSCFKTTNNTGLPLSLIIKPFSKYQVFIGHVGMYKA